MEVGRRNMPVRLLMCLLCLALALPVLRAQTAYRIEGTAPQGVHLVTLSTVQNQLIDTVAVQPSGRFAFSGTLPQHTFVTLTDDSLQYPLNIIIDGEPVTVDIARSSIRGSRLNERFHKSDTEITDLEIDYMQLQMEYGGTQSWRTARRDSLQRQLNSAYNSLLVAMKNAIRGNADNVIPALYLSQIYNVLSHAELKEYLDESHAYASHPLCRGAWRMLNHIEKTNIGQMFTDLSLADTLGVEHRLSEYAGRGRYVLVDFWASWCLPCLAEMPNVKANHDRYHSRGFDVVGLSFDRDRSSWVRAISSRSLDWVHLSDLKYWNSEASIVYGISSIPSNLLLDPDGRIIATDLRGEALGQKLAEIFY